MFAIKLDISKTPNNILRLFYVIKGVSSDSNIKITLPGYNVQFKRN